MTHRQTATPAEDRQARRRTLHLLLSRADRGVLSRDEAALLRAVIETELAAGDTARRAAGGQQAAVRRLQHRLAAAEQAIVEAEAERDRLTREAFDERKRHRADMREADRRSDEAETRALRAEQLHAENEATALRYANYLVAAQQACGARNWRAIPEQIRAVASRATQPERQTLDQTGAAA
ncbi:hypothetical protein ACIQNI_08885 [Streptomyces sp. NPDC091266]|uniref:hypothetical protein n=1 Tax=Streptomyces sp. NPDC091266 TaxID=3365978 RepID=UPI0037FF5F52